MHVTIVPFLFCRAHEGHLVPQVPQACLACRGSQEGLE